MLYSGVIGKYLAVERIDCSCDGVHGCWRLVDGSYDFLGLIQWSTDRHCYVFLPCGNSNFEPCSLQDLAKFMADGGRY